jgi:hypothetical protein
VGGGGGKRVISKYIKSLYEDNIMKPTKRWAGWGKERATEGVNW